MDTTADRPGVVVLPPLLYLGALVVGAVLEILRPWDLPVATPVRWVAGLFGVMALALAVRARMTFERAGTNVNPMQPATALVEDGPFRFTRNPMYVALSAFYLAIAVATRVGWFFLLFAPVLAVMHWGVVLREERYLEAKFGAPYDEYRRRVRRYV